MAKEKVSVESLVNEALRQLATADGPMRLSGKGDPPALFVSAAGANKDAIAQLQNAANPLVRTEGKNGPVKLTAAGFALALPSIPEEKVGSLAKSFAADIPTAAARVEVLQQIVGRTPLATAELLPVLEAATAAERTETEARLEAAKKRREAEEASRKAVERWVAALGERQTARVAALRRELEIEGAKVEAPPPPVEKSKAAGRELPPQTDDDHSYRRQTARRLVSSWLQQWQAGRDQGREAIEIAIGGMTGMRRVGTPGEAVAFDGVVHESERTVSDGQAVKVVRSGWQLAEDDGPYTLAKALVE